MRHRKLRRKLGIKSQHRRALLRNLVRELVKHKRIRTTHSKAKEASAFADRMVTMAKRGDMHARRQLVSKLACEATAKELIQKVAPQFKTRNGGYTRVLRLVPRPGDQTDMALLEFTVLIEEPKKAVTETAKKKAKKAPKAKTSKADAGESAPEKAPKAKEKAKAKDDEAPKAEEEKPEFEKKGGFLGSLRKFLKGTD